MTRARRLLALALGCLVAGIGAPARAQPPAAVTVPTPGGEVTVFADRLEEIGPDGLLIATGNVEIVHGTARLTADRVELDRRTGDAVATGRVFFYDGEDRLTGRRIDYNIRTGTGVVYDGSARAAPYYRLAGERMERLAESRYLVRRGRFTTCEDDPPAWSFRFAHAEADLEDFLWGTGGSFWVRELPLVPFIPVFAAAIRRERQTGFLFPRVGTSSRKGLSLELPFFWAISDSQDATLTLDAFEKRGVGATVEYRYILTRDHRGELDAFYVNEFLRAEPERPEGHDEHRAWWLLDHRWALGGGWGLTATLNGVSDDFVFREYGDPLPQRATQRAESNIFLSRSWATWSLVGNLFWYQDLTTRRPVELHRLPEVRLTGIRRPILEPTGLLGELEASAVNFVRDVGADGLRLDLHPRLSRPVPVLGLFTVTPFAGARLTGYEVTVTGTRVTQVGGFTVEETREAPLLRRLVELGADAETRAARVFELGGRGGIDALLHTIEPRVGYVWIEGDELVRRTARGELRRGRVPQFDPVDAIAETSTVTYALTNRVRARTPAPPGAEPTRWELLRLTVGHSLDLLATERPLGDLTADLLLDPGRLLSLRAEAAYNLQGAGLTRLNTDLALGLPRVTASVGTRFARVTEELDPVTLTRRAVADDARTNFLQGRLTAELTRHVTARLSTDWDLRTNTGVETRLAVDVRFQCWAVTVELVNRHRDEDGIFFTVHLLGVGAPIRAGAGFGGAGSPRTGG